MCRKQNIVKEVCTILFEVEATVDVLISVYTMNIFVLYYKNVDEVSCFKRRVE